MATRDPRYDILFDPVRIGPVTAPNRFYQVPHCNGMGRMFPDSMIAMRGVKAEGGWGIVSTEQCDFHPTGDVQPYTETRLWGDMDIPYLAGMANAVHEHGSLAALQLVHNGHSTGNLYSREVPIGPMHRPVIWGDHPVQARAMDLEDIRAFRRWHRNAALRAKRAGFDMVVVYAGHNGAMPSYFLSRRDNQRSDEYGGSLENRLRLYREILADTLEAVGDSMAVIARFAVDELMGPNGLEWQNEGRDAIQLLAEMPDMWDVNIADWANDSMTSRFAPEGYQEEYVRFVKEVTSKPVASVGRYTSPDTMAYAIRSGLLDLIGAARPSIADPFLPNKVKEGRVNDIRECIGCNICAAWNNISAPTRCTQNPTMGEEWRKGWHPEKIPARESDTHVLVVGAGPAGLEAAHQLGKRGYRVTVAEAAGQAGGRVTRESRLPNLGAWARVRDYRLGQIKEMINVELYLESKLTAQQVLEFGADHIAVATGSRWRRDGLGRQIREPIPGADYPASLSPDDIMDGTRPEADSVIVFDDDHFYMGGVIAELLVNEGYRVTLATTGAKVSAWTEHTLEQGHIERRLVELGVEILTRRSIESLSQGNVLLVDLVTGERSQRQGVCVPVTMRMPNDDIYRALVSDNNALERAKILSVRRLGDCYGPATIAAAIYEGHRYARELDTETDQDGVPFKTVTYKLELGG